MKLKSIRSPIQGKTKQETLEILGMIADNKELPPLDCEQLSDLGQILVGDRKQDPDLLATEIRRKHYAKGKQVPLDTIESDGYSDWSAGELQRRYPKLLLMGCGPWPIPEIEKKVCPVCNNRPLRKDIECACLHCDRPFEVNLIRQRIGLEPDSKSRPAKVTPVSIPLANGKRFRGSDWLKQHA